jgi:hypothetical protein
LRGLTALLSRMKRNARDLGAAHGSAAHGSAAHGSAAHG